MEPRIQDQNSRLLQPDLVRIRGPELVVLDVQVCADWFGMSRAREAKELKYGIKKRDQRDQNIQDIHRLLNSSMHFLMYT